MKTPANNLRITGIVRLAVTIAAIIIVASASGLLRMRLDLTEDKRYTLSKPTRDILGKLKNDVFVQVYLDGDIPVPLKRLRRSVMDMLEEFRIGSGRKVDYEFINPAEGGNVEQRNSRYQSLIKKGLSPIRLQAGDAEGGSSQKIIFPGMLINYNGMEVPVNFLNNDPTIPYEQNILHSIEGLEYQLIQTISTLDADTIYKVAFIEGQGELPSIETADITYNLFKFFNVDRGIIGGVSGALDKYSAIIVAGPKKEFSEADKLVIDQYIMNGGKVLWLLDEVYVNSDSLTYGETAGLYRPLNLEDQLFRYGARVNPAIVQDMECQIIRLKVVGSDGNQQFTPAPWIYNPLLLPSGKHPVTRNINKVKGEFTNYIDTVGLDPRIKKTILLTTSERSRTVNPPLLISLKEVDNIPDERYFNKSHLPVAVLLEGVFPSAFKNRMLGTITSEKINFMNESKPTRMIVVADGDIIRNEVQRAGLKETPLPLGQDRYTGMIYGNRDFIVNCLNYLVDDKGIMSLRSRELRIRLLNRVRVKHEKLKWQLINIAGPAIIVVIAGLLYGFLRKRKYAI
ncbi:MAG TPA: gliding motility-associated ABC transporter substrate-binding protein GldG [Bacteroidales bacterium]|nr:gliding motility-associated ABC transporter substrate-binding protein GldG [Bacteroidales bacterium]